MQRNNGILKDSKLSDEEMIQYYMILNKRGVISDDEFIKKVSVITQSRKEKAEIQNVVIPAASSNIHFGKPSRKKDTSFDAFVPAKKKPGPYIAVLIAAFSLIFIVVAVISSNHPSHTSSAGNTAASNPSFSSAYAKTPPSYPVLSKDTALSIALEYVKNSLKAPSTAKFSYDYNDYVFKNDGATWIISGYVDAQNSFGAMLRSNFEVKFTTYREDGKDMVHRDYVIIE